MQITSSANPRIKLIRKLREKKNRQESGLFYIEGLRIVIEAFEKNAGIETLIVSDELLQSDKGNALVEKAKKHDVDVLEVSKNVFESIALKENPQGLGAIVKQRDSNLADLSPDDFGLWTAFDSIADPGNLGTVMRTMDAVGGKGILLIGQSVDPYDPSAVRASMGALFSLKIVKASSLEFLQWKKGHPVTLIGTSDKARASYTEISYPKDLILLMGSERQGMQPELEKMCDTVVQIPMIGSSDSLNLAIANAVVLYEIFNQIHTVRGSAKDDRVD